MRAQVYIIINHHISIIVHLWSFLRLGRQRCMNGIALFSIEVYTASDIVFLEESDAWKT